MSLLPNRPVLYKYPDGRLEKVFHTVRARELEARGCCVVDHESDKKPKRKVGKPKPEAKEEKIEEKAAEPEKEKSVKRRRARDEDGKFIGDDPSTPEVNEAWTSLTADLDAAQADG